MAPLSPTTMTRALAILAALLLSAACRPAPPPPTRPDAGAVSGPADARGAFHFSRLGTFLPPTLLDWTGAPPTGSTSERGSASVSEVERAYARSGRTATIRIVDSSAPRAAAADPQQPGWEDDRRAVRPLLVSGGSGWAELDKTEGKAFATVVVADRFVVRATCDGASRLDEVERLIAALDLKGLAALAREPARR